MPRTPALELDWRRIAPDLPTTRAIRLHPRPGASPTTASKMGGPIAWPAREPWPRCDEHAAPLVPVLQLARDHAPSLPWPDGVDRLQLLWCPRDHEAEGHAPRTRAWWRTSTEEAWAESPSPGEGVHADYLVRACTLDPEEVVERPSALELASGRSEAIDEAVRDDVAAMRALEELGVPEDHPLYQYHLSVAPGTKAGGFVTWVQDPEVPVCRCGAAMQHLVTIASCEFDGAFQRWMPLDERSVWKQGYAARTSVQRAAGLMLGDMGSVFVFTCALCPSRPIETRMQGS